MKLGKKFSVVITIIRLIFQLSIVPLIYVINVLLHLSDRSKMTSLLICIDKLVIDCDNQTFPINWDNYPIDFVTIVRLILGQLSD